MPQVSSSPTASARHEWPPETRTGTVLHGVDPLHVVAVTAPSSPRKLPPQQYASPAVVIAHMCALILFCPEELASVAKVCPPATGTGTVRLVVVPSPT